MAEEQVKVAKARAVEELVRIIVVSSVAVALEDVMLGVESKIGTPDGKNARMRRVAVALPEVINAYSAFNVSPVAASV